MLDEKIFVNINNFKQGMFIKSNDITNPVLLFIHGGPGSPEIAFDDERHSHLEKLFTVCWWEQRGSGISYSKKLGVNEMNIDTFIEDTVAVVNYLKERFNKEKVYVMGHSWGTVLGLLTVKKYPELFYAYMGIGQVTDQDLSEKKAYQYMLDRFTEMNDKKMIKKLKKYPIKDNENVSFNYVKGIRSVGMMKLGIGIMHDNKSMMETVNTILKFKGYTFGEKIKFAKGSLFSLGFLWSFDLNIKMINEVPSVDIPLYIFQGKYDYQVSYELAKDFYNKIKCENKGFYTFENSAHSPCFEESDKMIDIISKDVLNNKFDLRDNN